VDWSNVIVGALALVGTLVGSLAGIRASNKVVDLRLKSLEEKVNKHNNLIERMAKAEQAQAVFEEKIRVANHRIDDLEREMKS
jgi:hypothetical protein